jgi:uncharacterized protein (TIGR03086 family)
MTVSDEAAQLTSGLELLESVVSYALGAASSATPQLLSRPTPCAAWDLEMLLDHVSDSIEVVNEAIAAGQVRYAQPPGRDGRKGDPIGRLRRQAARLRYTCATARSDHRLVAIGDRELTARCVAVTGAIEIAVHGWDISAACAAGQPVPTRLAAVLLSIAPVLIPAGIRPGLFADPVRLAGPACPGDQLIAFLGRRPSAATAGTA